MGRNDDALSICTKTLSQAMYISDKEKLNDLRILSVGTNTFYKLVLFFLSLFLKTKIRYFTRYRKMGKCE